MRISAASLTFIIAAAALAFSVSKLSAVVSSACVVYSMRPNCKVVAFHLIVCGRNGYGADFGEFL